MSVAASFNASDEAVLCEAPPTALAPGEGLLVNVSLSLNGIEHAYDRWLDADPTAVNPLPFEFVHATAERAVVDTLGSTSALGPISGGTLVIVHGTALARGHDRRCIFGTGVVNATLASYCLAVVTCSDASHRRRWMWAGWAWQAAAAWCRSG
jgi:hypothetical protein